MPFKCLATTLALILSVKKLVDGRRYALFSIVLSGVGFSGLREPILRLSDVAGDHALR